MHPKFTHWAGIKLLEFKVKRYQGKGPVVVQSLDGWLLLPSKSILTFYFSPLGLLLYTVSSGFTILLLPVLLYYFIYLFVYASSICSEGFPCKAISVHVKKNTAFNFLPLGIKRKTKDVVSEVACLHHNCLYCDHLLLVRVSSVFIVLEVFPRSRIIRLDNFSSKNKCTRWIKLGETLTKAVSH